MNQKQDTRFLDVLRWLATLDVVFYHVLNAAIAYTNIDNGGGLAYNIVAIPMRWHVPMFLMISGALFLNPEKTITYRALFTKYIRRLLLALCIFGFPMAFIEVYFNTRSLSLATVFESAYNVLAGQTWSHMWYLYMLIGIYLLTPMLKIFVKHAEKKDKLFLLIVIFVFTGLIQVIEEYLKIKIGFNITISSAVLGYYLLGHYMMYEVDADKAKKYSISGICVSLFIIWMSAIFAWDIPLGTNSPAITLLTCSLFCLARSLKLHSKFLSKTKGLAFGVFLTHMVFINFAYKFLRISPFDYPVWLVVPGFGTVFFAMALASSWVLNRIPFLRKYVM